jgi:hypothetical protein
MLHAYVQTFDVTGTAQKFLETKQGRNEKMQGAMMMEMRGITEPNSTKLRGTGSPERYGPPTLSQPSQHGAEILF